MAIRTRSDDSDSVFVKPREASRLTSLSTRTLARLADSGQLQSFSLPSGHRRYRRSDIARLVNADAREDVPA